MNDPPSIYKAFICFYCFHPKNLGVGGYKGFFLFNPKKPFKQPSPGSPAVFFKDASKRFESAKTSIATPKITRSWNRSMFGFSVGMNRMDLSQSHRHDERCLAGFFLFFFLGGLQIQKDTHTQKRVQQLKVFTCWPWVSMIYIDLGYFRILEYVRHWKKVLCVFLHLAHWSKCDGSRPRVTSVEERFSVLGLDCWLTGKVVCATCIGCGMGPLESWRKLVEVMFACEMVGSFRNTWIDKILGLVHCTFKVCVIRINIDCQETLYIYILFLFGLNTCQQDVFHQHCNGLQAVFAGSE